MCARYSENAPDTSNQLAVPPPAGTPEGQTATPEVMDVEGVRLEEGTSRGAGVASPCPELSLSFQGYVEELRQCQSKMRNAQGAAASHRHRRRRLGPPEPPGGPQGRRLQGHHPAWIRDSGRNAQQDQRAGDSTTSVSQSGLPDPVVVHASSSSRRRILDPCEVNPCQNGGLCRVSQEDSFRCSCPARFGGRLSKCYETEHLRYYDMGESWGRIHRRNVERCTCEAGETKCESVRYAGLWRRRGVGGGGGGGGGCFSHQQAGRQAVCHSNPCQNEGICRQITATGEEVCHCRAGYTGANCSFDITEPVRECFSNKGRRYLGNPDGDSKPWCYVLAGSALSWEHCDIPSCTMSVCE
ncbi:hypothetical protein CRUP_001310 [Coryphaenoides rupestris]|nr:hypothetical protein CRUP_001310 [Coryphaenoides rupestris]